METCVYERIYDLQTNGWWFGDGRNRIVGGLLKRLVKNFGQCKFLDVGCSEGAFIEYLDQQDIEVYAIDNDENAIKFCKKRGHEDKVRLGSILDIPFAAETFDVVTALDVVEHIEDDQKALQEILRVCKKQGTVLLIVPAHPWLWSEYDTRYHHKRRYNRRSIEKLLKSVGQEIEMITYFNMFLFPVFISVVFLKKIFPKNQSFDALKPVPRPLNWFLGQLMKIENWLINSCKIKLPFGSSMIVAIKNRRNE